MQLTSPAIQPNQSILLQYTCDGQNTSPPFTIEDVPPGAASLALVLDDPDAPAGVWDHWLVWNIPPDTTEVPEDSVPGVQGRNGWGRAEYGGPCPPRGAHRYFFRLYALDGQLDLREGATRAALEKAMQGHVLAEAELMGRYERRR